MNWTPCSGIVMHWCEKLLFHIVYVVHSISPQSRCSYATQWLDCASLYGTLHYHAGVWGCFAKQGFNDIFPLSSGSQITMFYNKAWFTHVLDPSLHPNVSNGSLLNQIKRCCQWKGDNVCSSLRYVLTELV